MSIATLAVLIAVGCKSSPATHQLRPVLPCDYSPTNWIFYPNSADLPAEIIYQNIDWDTPTNHYPQFYP